MPRHMSCIVERLRASGRRCRSGRAPGSRRAATSSGEISYSSDRVEPAAPRRHRAAQQAIGADDRLRRRRRACVDHQQWSQASIEAVEIAPHRRHLRRRLGRHLVVEHAVAQRLAASISSGVSASLIRSRPPGRRPSAAACRSCRHRPSGPIPHAPASRSRLPARHPQPVARPWRAPSPCSSASQRPNSSSRCPTSSIAELGARPCAAASRSARCVNSMTLAGSARRSGDRGALGHLLIAAPGRRRIRAARGCWPPRTGARSGRRWRC